MALLRRRRRTPIGGESYRDSDHALMPIPPTGGLVSLQLRNVEGRPLPGVTVAIVESEGLRRVVTESPTDPFGFYTAAVPSGCVHAAREPRRLQRPDPRPRRGAR